MFKKLGMLARANSRAPGVRPQRKEDDEKQYQSPLAAASDSVHAAAPPMRNSELDNFKSSRRELLKANSATPANKSLPKEVLTT